MVCELLPTRGCSPAEEHLCAGGEVLLEVGLSLLDDRLDACRQHVGRGRKVRRKRREASLCLFCLIVDNANEPGDSLCVVHQSPGHLSPLLTKDDINKIDVEIYAVAMGRIPAAMAMRLVRPSPANCVICTGPRAERIIGVA